MNRFTSTAIAALSLVTLTLASAPTAHAYPQLIGTAGLQPNAVNLEQYIANTYAVPSIGGVRPDRLPDHPSGHAIDIMTGGNMALGDQIRADVMAQAARFGVKYSLWRVANHYDHVHVTVY